MGFANSAFQAGFEVSLVEFNSSCVTDVDRNHPTHSILWYAVPIALTLGVKLFQLFTDLVLADFLVTHTSFVSKVVFQYVKLES
jgi:hypothetical protein